MGQHGVQIKNMDVLEWCRSYSGPPFMALLCDAPYELNFMGNGKKNHWDNSGISFRPDTWRALAQHLLPGAFGMCFASSRGWHRLACAIEDAGMIIHPSVFMLGWAQGSGWPKATRVEANTPEDTQRRDAYRTAAQDVDGILLALAESEHVSWTAAEHARRLLEMMQDTAAGTQPPEPSGIWAGHRYGLQALKPALEPIIVWQKPYQGKPVDSITATGAGALWIDGARLPTAEIGGPRIPDLERMDNPDWRFTGASTGGGAASSLGRWPPNLCLLHLPECQRLGTRQVPDPNYVGPPGQAPTRTEPVWQCSPECPVRRFDRQAGERASGGQRSASQDAMHRCIYAGLSHNSGAPAHDSGPASRFMYTTDWALDVAEQLAAAESIECVLCCQFPEKHGTMSDTNSQEVLCEDVSIASNFSPQNSLSSASAQMSAQENAPLSDVASKAQSNTTVPSAANAAPIMPAMTQNIVPPNAPMLLVAQTVRAVHDAALLCDSCATDFAQSLVRAWLSHSDPSTASQVSMLACKNTILTHNLAIAVERLGSTDITEIMTNPKTLSGFVINVIATCTRTKNETGPHTSTFHETVAENLQRAFPMRYTGKASRGEREEGLSGRNGFPCVKPIALCQWLATLLLPPAAYAPRRLLVPFCGTASEMIGAVLTGGWEEILGIEQDPATVAVGTQRLRWWTTQIAAQLSLWPS
jgi:hypothetical protein